MRGNRSTLPNNTYLNAAVKNPLAPSSPVKKENAGALIPSEDIKKPRQRRQTKAKEEIEEL